MLLIYNISIMEPIIKIKIILLLSSIIVNVLLMFVLIDASCVVFSSIEVATVAFSWFCCCNGNSINSGTIARCCRQIYDVDTESVFIEVDTSKFVAMFVKLFVGKNVWAFVGIVDGMLDGMLVGILLFKQLLFDLYLCLYINICMLRISWVQTNTIVSVHHA